MKKHKRKKKKAPVWWKAETVYSRDPAKPGVESLSIGYYPERMAVGENTSAPSPSPFAPPKPRARTFESIRAGQDKLHSGIVAELRAVEAQLFMTLRRFEQANPTIRVREIILERYANIGETLAGVHLRVTAR